MLAIALQDAEQLFVRLVALKHRLEGCARQNDPLHKFGERFAGKATPLSLAVAKVGGIDVQLSDEGRAELAAMESDPLVAEPGM